MWATSWVSAVEQTVPPHVGTAAVLIAAAIVTLMTGLVRGRRAFLPYLPGVLFVLAGAAVFWPLSRPALQRWGDTAIKVAALALVVHFAIDVWRRLEPRAAGLGSVRSARIYLTVALLTSAGLLLYHLQTYAGPLLIWEAPVLGGFPEVGGFARLFESGQSVLGYAAHCLLWDDGVLSAGQGALFYGPPTYALFQWVGFYPWTFRIAAVVATLIGVWVIYALSRRFFGPLTAAAAALAFALNSCVLFYGRYGSSPAGTLLATLLAVWAAWVFLDRRRGAWWMALVCAAALYVATLQYSPARIIVLLLIGFILVVFASRWRQLSWRHAVAIVLFLAAVGGVWQLQRSFGTTRAFLSARGEQYFDFVNNPGVVKELFGRDLLGRPVGPGGFTLADKLELLYRVVQVTFPQFRALMSPLIQKKQLSDDGLIGELPQLYYAPLVLFILWGLVHSLARIRSWPYCFLFLWLVGATIPLLLTNRVDTHRCVLFLIPLSLWAAFGIWQAARTMAQARVPSSVQHLFAGALALTVVYSDVQLLHGGPVLTADRAQTIVNEVDAVPGPVIVGAAIDHREVGWVLLHLLERTRRDPSRHGEIIPTRELGALLRSGVMPNEIDVRKLQRMVEHATVILAPAQRFRTMVAALQQRGVRAARRGSDRLWMWRLDAGAVATGVPDAAVKPLPIVIPPTPTPIPLAGGPQVSLTTLTPLEVSFGFAPPKVNRTWGDAPIVMGGVRYREGLGMHSWCRMSFAVPPGARAFQAVIGLSDDVKSCGAAAVTFEVRNGKGELLFDSGLIDGTAAPRPIRVDLHGEKIVTLVVTEGGNGRDCDHANWARPAFLLAPQ